MIALIAVTAAGRSLARRLAHAWPGRTTTPGGSVAEQFRTAWGSAEALVCFLATGATVRLIAPLLRDKHTDPGVVCVDEAGRFAVALVGGHAGGANALAMRVAGVLGAEAVVTTATDAVGVTPLDGLGADLGFQPPAPEAVAAASAAMLDGAAAVVDSDATWPLPAVPGAGEDSQDEDSQDEDSQDEDSQDEDSQDEDRRATVRLAVTDRLDAVGDAVYRPPSLVVGIGASRGIAADELDDLVDAVLADAGLAAASVRCLATVDLKADEPGIHAVAARRGWPLVTFTAAELSEVDVPNPSDVVRAAVGTPSVAEAAAVLAARRSGRDASLVAPKRASAMGTAAVARLVPRGRLTLVGVGPGAEDLRTPRAVAALRRASVVVGLDQYVAQVRHLLTRGTRIVASGLGDEEERVHTAVKLATEGNAVALVGSGDAGIYAMASPALHVAGDDVDVEVVPGITAAVAAAARLGAPLGHDHAYVSLSDLHTPWPVIADRLRACAVADLVVCLYNPRSRRRISQFDEAIAILAAHRPSTTPVGIVRDATRAGERVTLVTLVTLATLGPAIVDMRSVVIVGSSRTRILAGRMVTPRGYLWQS
jgi:cobalt-precorrin 5A hydrolase / cobalt-factor III methyltransferase / precorrin-3B C17-methyltransferase